jgi:hypothetical protein
VLIGSSRFPCKTAGEVTFAVKPTDRARGLLGQAGSLKAKMRLAYTPEGKKWVVEYRTATVTLTG